MRYFIFLFTLFIIPIVTPNTISAQTEWKTASKSCTNCDRGVSINSKVGMTCPHCGVRWASEITTYDRPTNTYKKTTPSLKSVTNYTYRQCNATAKSTGQRCKRGVSASTHYQCYQHK